MPGQLSEQAESDHALARSWPTSDDHDFLGVRPPRVIHRPQHHRVGDLLLIDEHELETRIQFSPQVLIVLEGQGRPEQQVDIGQSFCRADPL